LIANPGTDLWKTEIFIATGIDGKGGIISKDSEEGIA